MDYLRPTAPIAADALLPGDPGRALALAQDLLEKPLMSNHHRGLWGYHGTTAAGHQLTIQATGIGGPSTAIVLGELAGLGVIRAIRIGTCAARAGDLRCGEVVVAREAHACDGASRALGAGARVAASAALGGALERAAPDARALSVASRDLPFEPEAQGATDDGPTLDGAAAVDLSAASLFAVGRRLEIETACLLTVASTVTERISDDRLAEAEIEMGRIALRALED